MADPMITPAPLPPLFLRLHARQTDSSFTPQCSLCTTTALSLAKCTSDYDPVCTCSGTLFASYLTSCMSSQTSLGCVPSDFTEAASTISATCRYWTSSLGSSLCQSCATLAATAVTCANLSDYPCLCRPTPTTAPYLLSISSCAAHPLTLPSLGATVSCAFTSLTALTDSLASSCSSYSSSTSAFPPGCPACQAQAADRASCSGKLDWPCLCTAGGAYLPALSSCINSGSCPNSDYTIAQGTYTSACAVVKTGGTPIISSPAANTAVQTGSSSSSSSSASSPRKSGGRPGIALIAGAAAGVLILLALLCFGGFLVLRRRKTHSPPKNKDTIPLQPTGAPPDYKDGGSNFGPQEADGVAVPGHPSQAQVPFQKQQQGQGQLGMWPVPAGYAEAPSPSVSPAPGWGQQGQQGYYPPPPPGPPPPRVVGGYVEMGGGDEERRRRAEGGKAYFELPGH